MYFSVVNVCDLKNDNLLASCEFFNVEKYIIDTPCTFSANAESFNSILCLEGAGEIEYQGECFPVYKGDSYFVPAGIGEYSVSGNLEIIISKI